MNETKVPTPRGDEFTPPAQGAQRESRREVLGALTTPLAFFGLALLVAESVFGGALVACQLTEIERRTLYFYAAYCLTLVVAVVAFLVFTAPRGIMQRSHGGVTPAGFVIKRRTRTKKERGKTPGGADTGSGKPVSARDLLEALRKHRPDLETHVLPIIENLERG